MEKLLNLQSNVHVYSYLKFNIFRLNLEFPRNVKFHQ